ncbi:glycosyltransferase [Acidisoma cladoniae]|uniref:glycosyltransferase n=1 Tax=Acidisoma cladoniae TaxID=3040935 RepID=UPI00254E9FB8|nr:glycosyltransferase [Acidisoma sp. PAMC 29798]
MAEFLETLMGSFHYLTGGSESLTPFLAAFQALEPDAAVAKIIGAALASLLADRPEEALRHLEYAQRLSPSQSLITLLIGDLRLSLGRRDAAEPFDLLIRRTGWSGMWLRMARTRLLFGEATQAAADLHETLSRNAPDRSAAMWALANDIADATGAFGWCGLDNQGIVMVGGAAAGRDRSDIAITLDGEPLQVTGYGARVGAAPRRFRIRGEWANGALLRVAAKGVPLIGSPIAVQSVRRIEGFVSSDHGALHGWCWLPGQPGIDPRILMRSRSDSSLIIETEARYVEDVENLKTLALRKSFDLTPQQILALGGGVDVVGPNGGALYGSPLNPLGETRSAVAIATRLARRFPALGAPEGPLDDDASEMSIPAGRRGLRSAQPAPPHRRDILIVIPVYRGLQVTLDCIESVLLALTPEQEILVVVDASPDPLLVERLRRLATAGKITLSLQPINRGFPITANVGLRAAAERDRDVILLNSDTLVTPGWVEMLRAAVDSGDDIGTATPLSNAATIFSYPDTDRTNPIPDLDDACALAIAARAANGDAVVDVPTGHGFCIYIRYECLLETGLLRDDVFGQGYGEENDFCMRARHLGWRHVAVPGAYVGHIEGQSFTAAKTHLTKRNLAILNRLHPGYDRLIAAWQTEAPLALYRRAIDLTRWFASQGDRDSLLLVAHDRSGGVLKHVNKRAIDASERGFRDIVLKPHNTAQGRFLLVESPSEEAYPNLRFDLDRERAAFIAFLIRCNVTLVEVHHFIGQNQALFEIITELGLPYEVYIHDYSWFCPRITLTNDNSRYCGEPNLAGCTTCVRDHGSNLGEDIMPAALQERSARLFLGARSVIVPSGDVARRIAARFPVQPAIEPWESTTRALKLKPLRPVRDGEVRRICVAGAIGYEKGYEILLSCARMAAEARLPIEFVVAGFTCDDLRLLETGRVRITGRYEEPEAVDLIRRQDTDVAFLPALWPETWSYVLTQFWDAGLPVVAFDIGTPSERIRAHEGGILLPLGMPTKQILSAFLRLSSGGGH